MARSLPMAALMQYVSYSPPLSAAVRHVSVLACELIMN
jgi:hypothetical protein